mgnify:CR=1 FL=1
MVAAQHEKSSRDRVLAAARDLFNSHGFHQTSMAELASAAQVSVGQIYRLFKGKEDIIEAIVHADADQWAEDVDILRKRLDSGELSIDDTFEQLMLHVIDEKDEALSFDILPFLTRFMIFGVLVDAPDVIDAGAGLDVAHCQHRRHHRMILVVIAMHAISTH